ncbi:hypothetical protein LUZ60_011843 [Juncus effusus]|nr:hypothetical protein LUZ60_011843 [Juncus effusus]
MTEMQEEIDKISSLPDYLIHCILSFLTTKESLQTSLLSKRWINVWKSVPRLDLNFSDFNQVEKFVSFVNWILHHKISNSLEKIDSFNLRWKSCTEENEDTINDWICDLVSLRPKEVHVDLSKTDDYFSSYLFDCPSIERLFLWTQMNGAWGSFNPDIVNLLFLKSLNLGWVNLKEEFIQRLVSSCPVIEELTFENCFLGVTEKITCLSLKKLTIRNTVSGPDTLLRIFMPNLEYLSCQIHWGRVDFVNLSNLQHAIVNLYGLKIGYGDSDNLEKFKLLKGLSNAKTLQLSGSLVNRMLKKEARNLPVFENLESLDLISFTINDDLDPIDLFLNRTPNLKKLILQNISMEIVGLRGFHDIQCGNHVRSRKR